MAGPGTVCTRNRAPTEPVTIDEEGDCDFEREQGGLMGGIRGRKGNGDVM